MATFRKPNRSQSKGSKARPAARRDASLSVEPNERIGCAAVLLIGVAVLFATVCFGIAYPEQGTGDPAAIGDLVYPGALILLGGLMLAANHTPVLAVAGVLALGLALLGAGLDHLYPGAHLRLLMLPCGFGLLAWSFWLMTTEEGLQSEHFWGSAIGSLMFGIAAIVVGLG